MSAVTHDLIHSENVHCTPIASDASMTSLARVEKILRRWNERAKQRQHLSGLTARELEDVGISVEAAAAEVAKPFWRA